MGVKDQLASGAKTAMFGGPSGVSQLKWDLALLEGRAFKRRYGISKTEYHKQADLEEQHGGE